MYKPRDERGLGFKAGVEAAADFLTGWDGAFAPATNGYRISDIVLCKFNMTRRKRPRKYRRRSTP